MEWLIAVAGALLVAAALADIVLTVLHTQKESRISWAFNRSVWATLRLVARLAPRNRYHHVLAWGIPLMIGGMIALWASMLILGYALIYRPWIDDPAHFGVPERAPWPMQNALYHSGVSLATLGYGDTLPLSAPFRLLSVVEGLNGLVVISLSITFLLTLYPSLSRKNILARMLNEESAGRADALPMVSRYLSADNFEALANRLVALNDHILEVAEAHRLHSVLYYSHPVLPQDSLVRILIVVRGLLGTLSYGLYHDGPEERRAYWDDPRVLTLHDSFVYTLRTLADSIHVSLRDEIQDDESSRRALYREYEGLRAELCALGLVPAAGGGRPEEFATFRVASDNYINAYRKHSGYTDEEIEQRASRTISRE